MFYNNTAVFLFMMLLITNTCTYASSKAQDTHPQTTQPGTNFTKQKEASKCKGGLTPQECQALSYARFVYQDFFTLPQSIYLYNARADGPPCSKPYLACVKKIISAQKESQQTHKHQITQYILNYGDDAKDPIIKDVRGFISSKVLNYKKIYCILLGLDPEIIFDFESLQLTPAGHQVFEPEPEKQDQFDIAKLNARFLRKSLLDAESQHKKQNEKLTKKIHKLKMQLALTTNRDSETFDCDSNKRPNTDDPMVCEENDFFLILPYNASVSQEDLDNRQNNHRVIGKTPQREVDDDDFVVLG